ncbi:MAG: DUF4274 domain-containing protein [Shewanella sp.]|uniref:DUF4274 domain-containing protein n=1 Tax=unclassified Shewanella TaxID=196818 RepID=UPI0021DAE43C|nr:MULTISPECIES: DUF4274 domain-containing protein [unclassified Shewanella]MCU8008923.1 DUF4274 domain-containing protein [Shewanella sp. SM87]MCU8033051.1 DUF4274 domain-containing protein [Shewanella sp. SM71]MCU8074722.1 DUF4274 domain-containing protein [Shewanella sp. SM29]MCU8096440.1 DUF4274 domain-containing protein [Shewanella sp. SM102]
MAKLLSQEQFIRAYECAEFGCFANQQQLAKLLANPDYDFLHQDSTYFGKAATQITCISDLQSMEELHFVAANLNWDNDDPDMVRAIIEHPLCDAGTALLLYWYGQGFYYSTPETLDTPFGQLFKTITDRFVARGYASYKIHFDPIKECFMPSLEDVLTRGCQIPGAIFAPYSTMEIETYEGHPRYLQFKNELLKSGKWGKQ